MATGPRVRHNQKERTRREIVAAAARLVAEGVLPTMPRVAEEALVSTATAYRYFPDQLSLLSAAMQDGAASAGERFVPDIGQEPDVVRRADLATEGMLRRVLDREALVRAVMAHSLLRSVEDDANARERAASARPGFRHAWIDEALRPVQGQVPKEQLRRLRLALGVVLGLEAVVALQDVMGIETAEAVEVCRWMARTLTEATLREAGVSQP
jgi:AcrR family transcriptional regulator